MNRLTCLAIMGCSALIAGCETGTTPPPAELEWAAAIEGEGDWAHVTGASAVATLEGTGVFTAVVEIADDAPGAVRPWHVHFNTCAEGGGIVGADADYPRLEVGATGTAAASATVSYPLNPAASYHVNVHRSEAEMDVIIACGDLTLAN